MQFLKSLPALFLIVWVSCAQAEELPAKPNIIFILSDDLGIGGVSCYGADNFQTPNIDKLAGAGTLFEHCYASPLCGPSRALLLTGRYAFRTGMTNNNTGHLVKPANEIMIPRVLKASGYVTAQVGKWSQLPLQPSDWGFDEYLRFSNSGRYWNTQPGNKFYTLNGKQTPLGDGEYLPDKMHEFLVDFIERHKDQPFYVHYAMSHIHQPILRTPDSAPGSQTLYKDNIVYMDKLVGKLTAELDLLHLREKTLVIFASDNGTATPFKDRCTVHGKSLSGWKNTMLECGALVPMIAVWPGKTPAGQVSKRLVSFCDVLPTLAEITSTPLPKGVTLDGKSFAPLLLGKPDAIQRDWIFVMLRHNWYDRELTWKLNQSGELFDMTNAPYTELLIPNDTQNADALSARQRLQTVLTDLNPGGIFADHPDRHGKKSAAMYLHPAPLAQGEPYNDPENANEPNE